jgi:maltokinase
VAIVAETELTAGDPALLHLIIAVYQGDGVDRYQVLAGIRSTLPDRLEHAKIGDIAHHPSLPAGLAGRSAVLYDAAHDSELTSVLLRAIAAEETIGPIRFARVAGAQINTGLESLAMPGEQSNTSLVFGEEAILKLFRRVAPGPNPDLEVTSALARFGSSHIAPPYGWIETRLDGAVTTLAIMSRFLPSATDGWSLAGTSVRDLYAGNVTGPAEAGGDFAAEAHRLGIATAEVHRDLAEAFGTDEMAPDSIRDLTERMYRRLDVACAAVPALTRYAEVIGAAFGDLAKADEPLTVQRVHGDYHLGQVVRTDYGWVVLDFEGEPAKPLAERRAMSPALRDVAAMLRSFEYAARYQLVGNPHQEQLADLARAWAQRNGGAFCDGYAEASGSDPRRSGTALRAFELDKAVYEVMYEARNRPSWLSIPLESLPVT